MSAWLLFSLSSPALGILLTCPVTYEKSGETTAKTALPASVGVPMRLNGISPTLEIQLLATALWHHFMVLYSPLFLFVVSTMKPNGVLRTVRSDHKLPSRGLGESRLDCAKRNSFGASPSVCGSHSVSRCNPYRSLSHHTQGPILGPKS